MTNPDPFREAFLTFLVDSNIESDVDGEDRPVLTSSDLKLDQLAKALGFPGIEEAMYEAELWERPPVEH